MGLFNKKKNPDASSSVLSESEIQKKLYGEFSKGTSPVVTGGREPVEEFVPPAPSKEPSLDKVPFDLFSAQTEALSEQEVSNRRASSEQKPADHASRYVPLRDFEKKPVSPVPGSPGTDSYARFQPKNSSENRLSVFADLGKGFSEKTGELFREFLDPRQVALRRVLYWGTAVLVVFLLFWGVNTLNSQREEAMRSRYKIPGESVAEKSSVSAPVTVPSKPVTQRPVVVPPVPDRTSKPLPGTAPKPDPYVIQVVTYPSSQDAESIVKNLKSSGFRAFVKESPRSGGRVFYMVLIGGFRTVAEAQSQLSKFRGQEISRPFQDAFVRTNRS